MNITELLSIFSFIMFFILIRESIIDIKTQYVPDNVTISAYAVSIVYMISAIIINHNINPLKDGFFGFIIGFGIPFGISMTTYYIQKFRYKRYVKKYGKEEESEDDMIEVKKESKKLRKIKEYILYLLSLSFVVIISVINNASISMKITIPVSVVTVILMIIAYKKTSKIDLSFYILAIVMSAILTLLLKSNAKPWFAIIGFIVEYILFLLFKRFDNLEKLVKEENEELENSDEEPIYGGIGGGDIMLFGALGIMYGPATIGLILMYSCFCQMLVIISYYFLLDKNDFASHIPFVPGIALATFLVCNGFDFFNIKILFSIFTGGY